MQTVGSIATMLAQRTRPDRAAGWDPVGLQLGDASRSVTRVAVCHEITEATLDRLVGDRPELAITYHPLLFRPVTHLVAGATPGGRAWRMIDAGISLLVTHTDFDACPGGTADSLAQVLGLKNVTAFGPVEASLQTTVVVFVPTDAADRVVAAMADAGAGRIGNYDHCSFRSEGVGSFRGAEGSAPVIGQKHEMAEAAESRIEMICPVSATEAVVAALVAAHPYEEPAFNISEARWNQGLIGRLGEWSGTLGDLAEEVGQTTRKPGLRVAGDPTRKVQRVAVVPGSGSSFVSGAARAGADVVVTGDVSHHAAADAVARGLAIVDPGHAATELPGMRALVEFVRGFGAETIDLTGDGSGPWSNFGFDSLR